ncbi:MAG: SUMF1/EgtB/PvdO family nonheme iron enzyme [Phycisphaerales bacterium]
MRLLSIRADAGKSGQSEQGGRARVLAGVLTLAAMGVFVVGGVGGVSTALAQLPPAPAGVEVTTIHGIEFSTIGNPGNRAPTDQENRTRTNPFGSVPYTYRMARTELTAAQYLPFIQAYAEAFPSQNLTFVERSSFIRRAAPGEPLSVIPGYENWAVDVPFGMAMRYCNWLHNDRVGGVSGIEGGVYDMSLVRFDSEGRYSDTITRSANAKFWLPSINEWVKAGYYDPNRYGPGQDGYWYYPHRSELPPVPGVDSDIGLSILEWGPVVRFPHAQSPWGLFDVSGSSFEWSDATDRMPSIGRVALGSGIGSPDYLDELRISASRISLAHTSLAGIRIATIPTPAGGAILVFACGWFAFRSRRYV